ncbi:DUF5317 family protein [Cellulomonas sp. S1-8]|uniref:DUF5317 family protein n=1 Tax=Cellulomonas sp. S1-8 TaxID=2904790 RepID=UPI002242EB72|nr:DUF5317 family protein [Cellulomonas sp. S1-8]UZN02269.1 DUF5317 domain-containing protein [Cellulomonas sp. S1-8]UZN02338.1 DUF5317 domain-containing protein [Cellulomonas sp. S1-8]
MSAGQLLVLLVVPVLALVVVLVRGEGVAALAHVRVRGLPWVLVGALVQVVRTADPAWAGGLLHTAGGVLPPLALAVCATGFVLANAGRAGRAARLALAAVLAGAAANALATALNGGMPFSVDAARTAGIAPEHVAAPTPGHVPVGPDTDLVALSDVIGLPGLGVVLSIGDLLLWGGLAAVLVLGVRRAAEPTGDPGEKHHPTQAGVVPATERSTR